jgi:hypothetical protein
MPSKAVFYEKSSYCDKYAILAEAIKPCAIRCLFFLLTSTQVRISQVIIFPADYEHHRRFTIKSTALELVVLFVPFVAGQWMGSEGPLSEKCGEVCESSGDDLRQCDRAYNEDITIEEHLACMCDDTIPSLAECVSCGTKASGEELAEEWENYSGIVDLYSSVLCTPGASRYLDEVLESMMHNAAPTPVPSTTVESTVMLRTPAATPPQGDDNNDGDENENENVTTAGAPVYTQAPFMLAAAGVALAAVL